MPAHNLQAAKFLKGDFDTTIKALMQLS